MSGVDWYRFLPRYWVQSESTDREWSKILDALIDKHGVTDVCELTCKVGSAPVWIGNWPYGYGNLYSVNRAGGLPTVAVRKKLRRAVSRAVRANFGVEE